MVLENLKEELIKEMDSLIHDVKRISEHRLSDKSKLFEHNHNLKSILLRIREESTKFFR